MSCKPMPMKVLDQGQVGAVGVGRIVHYVAGGRCRAAVVVDYDLETGGSSGHEEPLLDLFVLDADRDWEDAEESGVLHHASEPLTEGTWHFPERG